MSRFGRRWIAPALAVCSVLLLAAGSVPAKEKDKVEVKGHYVRHDLVSDGSVPADKVDPDLVNGWGVAFNPNGFVWVSDADTRKSTLYDGAGNKQSLVVAVPSGPPTGIVFNSSNDFKVGSGPARFLFATEAGTIEGWVPPATTTLLAADNGAAGAIYKGLALGGDGKRHLLYATDFHNARIDVFDAGFAPVALPGAFSDPFVPRGFAPFGIQNIGGAIYVTYAKQDADAEDEIAGPGLGYVAVFDGAGRLVRHFSDHARLNAPWGLALAPADFGRFGGLLLVGNFGDGRITAMDPATGRVRGQLRTEKGGPIEIEGLWGLQFGNGILDQPTSTLFFAAGPNEEAGGLYGRLDPMFEVAVGGSD